MMGELWGGWTCTAATVGEGLIAWSWHVTLLLMGMWVVTGLMPRRWAALRNSCWLMALLLLPVLPVAARISPLPSVALRPSRAAEGLSAASADVPAAEALTTAPPGTSAGAPDPSPRPVASVPERPAVEPARWPVHLAGALVMAWLLGVAVMVIRLLMSARWVGKLCRRATEVRDHRWLDVAGDARWALGLPRPVDLRTSDDVPTPVTIGLVWPVVILPTELLISGRRALIENAIYHEMAHVKRWDSVVTLYQRLLEALLFFHPLVWVAGRRYVSEREHICDDWAVSALRDRHTYARALTELAEMAVHTRRVSALSFAHRPSAIRRRVTRVLEGKQMEDPRLGVKGTVMAGLVSLLVLAVAGSVQLTAHAAQPAPAGAAEATEELPAAEPQAKPAPQTLVLKHDDGSMDGEWSLSTSGHFVRFEARPGKWYLTEVQIYGSRYGTPQPPKDTFTITVCNEEFQTLHYIEKPYSVFAERGAWRGYPVPVPPLELPQATDEKGRPAPAPFWINVAFNPSKTKGVYLGYDSSGWQALSKTGLPDQKPRDIEEGYNWMVRLVITNDPPSEVSPELGEWREPAKPLVPWQEAGLTEIGNDDGESDGKLSISGSGPVVRFENVPEGSKLTRLRMYASRYGSGYEPDTTYADYYIFDDDQRLLQTGRIPYSRFAYEEKWVEVPLKPVKVPGAFWVLINPNAHKYKGIYTHYDKDVVEVHSKYGRIPEELNDLREPWDWMIRAYVEPPGAEAGKPPAQ